MKLIREEIESVKFLVETTKSGKKSLYIEGVFLQGEIKNRNGRMYPMETLRKEVARYNESNIVSGRALGELGHPDGPTVNLDRVSHKIVSLKESGSNFIGKAKILSTPMGKIASSLIDEGVKLGVSSRGIGSLRTTREGVNIVGDDFMLATAADIVADPSAPDAFVEGIMEGKDWVWEGGILRERQAEMTKKRINTLVDTKQLEENKLFLFDQFLSNL
nr:prohead core scaffold and protease [uncultured Mediterranean phage uvMED]|tara:strand:+ start:2288 stop:2941 length:654 start_codon:yes stop_codon:yes gene_type:complete